MPRPGATPPGRSMGLSSPSRPRVLRRRAGRLQRRRRQPTGRGFVALAAGARAVARAEGRQGPRTGEAARQGARAPARPGPPARTTRPARRWSAAASRDPRRARARTARPTPRAARRPARPRAPTRERAARRISRAQTATSLRGPNERQYERPVSAKNTTSAVENTSDPTPGGNPPNACSGESQGAPSGSTAPGTARATVAPKSASCTSHAGGGPTNTLLGFNPRCGRPRSCAPPSARASNRTSATTSSGDRGQSWTRCASDGRALRSVTTKAAPVPVSTPTSRTSRA